MSGVGARVRAAVEAGRLGLLTILAVMVARLAIFFAPAIVFDADPAFVSGTIAGLGPAGSLRLDVLVLFGAALVLLGEALAGRGVAWGWMLLGLLPVPWVIAHGRGDLDDLWLGAGWSSAIVAGIAIAHVARDPARRTVILAIVVAALVPVLARAAANVTYEHDETVAQFMAERAEIFADRGWQPESSSAKIFERRLRQRQPTAWFMTTNVFATAAGAGLLLATGLALASWRARLPSGWTGVAGLLAGGCAVGLAMTGSKGAWLATAGGLAVLVAMMTPLGVLLRRWAPRLGAAAIVATLLGVAVRGAVLPEDFAADRSLLFRWHYARSAAAAIADAPLTGVGPGGFQAAHALHRPARSPEEVTSAHSAVWDWTAGLGLAGLAWTGLLVWMLVRAGVVVRGAAVEADADAASPSRRDLIGPVLVVAMLALGSGAAAEWEVLDGRGLLVRGLGLLGFIGVALVLAPLIARTGRRAVQVALLAAVLAIAVHTQIEMTLTQPGAALWCWVLIGVAAPCPDKARPWTAYAAAVLGAAFAIVLALVGSIPASAQERDLREAATPLWPIAEARRAVRAAGPDGAVPAAFQEQLREAAATLGVEELPTASIDRDAASAWAWQLDQQELRRRPVVADLLATIHDAWPTGSRSLRAAARQLERAVLVADEGSRAALLERALELAERAATTYGDGASIALASRLWEDRAGLSGDRGDLDRAIEHADRLTRLDPRGNRTWLRMADLLWRAERFDDARAAYQRAIAADDAFELDPLKQLPVDDRSRAEIRARP